MEGEVVDNKVYSPEMRYNGSRVIPIIKGYLSPM
jgi:hypothetical protein